MIADDVIREYLKTLESSASDSLGDLGCHMIEEALDSLSDKFNLTDEEIEKLSERLAVGVMFELD